jgi:hypothetical protein
MIKMKRKKEILAAFCIVSFGLAFALPSVKGWDPVNIYIADSIYYEEGYEESGNYTCLTPYSPDDLIIHSEGGMTDRIWVTCYFTSYQDLEDIYLDFELTSCDDKTVKVYVIYDDDNDGVADYEMYWGNLNEDNSPYTRDESGNSDDIIGVKFRNYENWDPWLLTLFYLYGWYKL